MKTYRGSESKAPHFPKLDTGWRKMFSATPGPFYVHNHRTEGRLDRRVGLNVVVGKVSDGNRTPEVQLLTLL